MKQLTRNEIIELRARAIWEIEQEKGTLTFDECKAYANKFNKGGDFCYELMYQEVLRCAEATIEADEKAGVLMLVDDEPKKGDVITFEKDWFGRAIEVESKYKVVLLFELICKFVSKEESFSVIQRNNTPVYQCKKEVAND